MKENDFIPVRLSHILRHCSVGSIIRGPDYLMTVKDIRDWKDRNSLNSGRIIHYVEQVKSSLNIHVDLREPPIAKVLDSGKVDGLYIPAMTFPTWMICPECGLLHLKPWKNTEEGDEIRCQEVSTDICKKKPKLEQVSLVMVHREGHMTDVPWHFLAHRDSKTLEQQQCRADWREPYLKIKFRSTGSQNRFIICGRCKSITDLIDDTRIPYGKNNKQPWLREIPEQTDELAVIIDINDTRIHSPHTLNALVIPPESRIKKGTVVDRLYSSSEKNHEIDNARTLLSKRAVLKKISREFRCSVNDIEIALDEIRKGYPLYGQSITKGLLLENEYTALIEELPNLSNDEDLVTYHMTKSWKALKDQYNEETRPYKIIETFDQIVSIHRLKEIMIYAGFSRFRGELVPPDIEGQSDWLPALELYGEGIFIRLNIDKIKNWEAQQGIKERTNEFRTRFHNSGIKFDPEIIVNSRLILLHTISHLLIRQLETEAGYPAASLKERIYSSRKVSFPMAGILIYVAVPDIVGSLGGLYELAKPKRFLKLISKVFDQADWCSLDPVCSEHIGQGPGLLNKAACHACSLIPEPSCAYGNLLLDRTFVKGDDFTGIKPLLNC